MEDAGFDWKILGPDVQEEEYVAHTCDQDAYAYRYKKQHLAVAVLPLVNAWSLCCLSCIISSSQPFALLCTRIPRDVCFETCSVILLALTWFDS